MTANPPKTQQLAIKRIADQAAFINQHVPKCFDGFSVVPNVFTENSLFSASSRSTEQKEQLVKAGDRKCEIYFSGDSLSQADLNVLLRIVAMFSIGKNKIGENIWLPMHQFLEQEYGYGKVPPGAYDRLESTLKRLYLAEVILLRPEMPPFFCRLISGLSPVFFGNGNKKMIEISIDATLRTAFKIEGHTFVNLRERGDLGNNQLALWLHLYFCRHTKPFPLTAKYIFENSGSHAKDFIRWVRCTLSPAVLRFNALGGWELFLDLSSGAEKAKLFCKEKPKGMKKSCG